MYIGNFDDRKVYASPAALVVSLLDVVVVEQPLTVVQPRTIDTARTTSNVAVVISLAF